MEKDLNFHNLKTNKWSELFTLVIWCIFLFMINIFTARHFVPPWQVTASRNDVIKPTVWVWVNRCFRDKSKVRWWTMLMGKSAKNSIIYTGKKLWWHYTTQTRAHPYYSCAPGAPFGRTSGSLWVIKTLNIKLSTFKITINHFFS